MKWSNKDWFWLTLILIAIIICILTFRLSDNQSVNEMFSFVSSAVSIALAIVAIGMATKQEVENKRVQDEVNKILIKIEMKVNSMNDTVQKIAPEHVRGLAEEKSEQAMEQTLYKEEFSKDEVEKLINEALTDYGETIINEMMNNNTIYLNSNLHNDSLNHLITSFVRRNPNTTVRELTNEFNISTQYAKKILNEVKQTVSI